MLAFWECSLRQVHLELGGLVVTAIVLAVFSLNTEQFNVQLVDQMAEEVAHLVTVVIGEVHLSEGVVNLPRPVLVEIERLCLYFGQISLNVEQVFCEGHLVLQQTEGISLLDSGGNVHALALHLRRLTRVLGVVCVQMQERRLALLVQLILWQLWTKRIVLFALLL